MAIPTTLESLSTSESGNGPAGTDDRSIADNGLRYAYAFIRQTVSLGSNIASASTITPPSTGYAFNITGNTTITTIASTNSWDGRLVLLIFAGALTLTHSSNLALPGSINITTQANDTAEFVQTASGAWRCINYFRAGSGLDNSARQKTETTGRDLLVSDKGYSLVVNATLTLTVQNSVFTGGDVVYIYNNSGGNITVAQGAGHTLRLGGSASTGNRTLADNTEARLYFINSSVSSISGSGVS